MMDNLENMKSKTIQFHVEMVKKRLSEVVLEDILKAGINTNKIEIVNIDIENKENLIELKEFLDNHKSVLKKGLYDYCFEEYREIKEDLKFRNTKDGQLIIQLENWVQVQREILPQFEPSEIFIGRSLIDPKKLIIGGILNGLDEWKIMSYFEERNPPVKPDYQFEINSDFK